MKYVDLLRTYAPKRLIAARYFADGACCALGVCVPELRDCDVRDFPTSDRDIATLAADYESVKARLTAIDLSVADAEDLQVLNDVLEDPPEHRYATLLRVLALVEAGTWTRAVAADTLRIARYVGFLEALRAKEVP